jgi:hypothetical protein
MNPDGTGQTVFYGNNTWFPTAILHARAIPRHAEGRRGLFGPPHRRKGWLGILDPSRGRQENQGAQLIAPVRKTEAVRIDAYGQEGDQFQYPYPLSETESSSPSAQPLEGRFAVYWMDQDGRRELLAPIRRSPAISPCPWHPGPCRRHARSQSITGKKQGTYYLQDIYAGRGLAGISRARSRSSRVVP